MDFIKVPVPIYPFYKLESENSNVSNEDTESVYSLQDIETDLVGDTSDTEYRSIGSEYELEIEYEVDSLSECDSDSFLESSDNSEVERDIVLAAAAAICDTSFEKWVTDGEDSENSSSEDNQFYGTDFGICIKCKTQHKNPRFRYCEKCFQDRKTLFPPRPRHRKPKKTEKLNVPEKQYLTPSCLNILSSQDSGIGSSQESQPQGPQSPDAEQISSRKRKTSSSSSQEEIPIKKCKSNIDPQTQSKSDDVATSLEMIDNSSKTSDLGSEISSGSGLFDKAEDSQGSLMESKEMCIFCNVNPKNAIFLHGNIAHMCCCYKCAKKTWRTIKRCPICNRRVNNVVRVYKT